MTKQLAYEKLELPLGSDLQVVRQKFQQMHNSLQVQIDGAFREDMRQKLQARLMELEEAYKLLNESEKADDSASLPRTEKTFEQNRTEEAKAHTTQLSLQQALALFGLTDNQDVAQIDRHIASHISNLKQQLLTSPLQTVKDAYQIEIDKTTSAKKVISKWLDSKKNEEETQQGENAKHTLANQVDSNKIKRWYDFIYILFLSSIGLLFIELILNSRLVPLFSYVIGVIIVSVIILNHYAPILIPPALQKNYLKGKGTWTGLFFLILGVLGIGILIALFKLSGFWDIDLSRSANNTLRIVSSFIYLLIMGGGGILGLINPKTILFKNRKNVLKALIILAIAHLIICFMISMLLILPSQMLPRI